MDCPILLIDANSFFASCHIALNPSLADLPVVVGGDEEKRHGICLAANYVAKRGYGVKTGMTVREARDRVGDKGVFFSPLHSLYVDFSARILRIKRRYSPLVEPFSIDESWVDLQGTELLHKTTSSLEIADRLQKEILAETGIPVSVGVGPNKIISKMAAGIKKPLGITKVDFSQVSQVFWPLPVRELFGVGRRMERHLWTLNIHTIGDLANYPAEILKKRFGLIGLVLKNSANGIDYSPVNPASLEGSKSAGHQITLPQDIAGHENIRVIIHELAETVSRRVRISDYTGKTVGLTLKDTDFRTLYRTRSMPIFSDQAEDLYEAAADLLHLHWPPWKPVRLVGLTLARLIKKKDVQLDLFGEVEKKLAITKALDTIKDRHGEKAIFKGISLTDVSILFHNRWGGADNGQHQ